MFSEDITEYKFRAFDYELLVKRNSDKWYGFFRQRGETEFHLIATYDTVEIAKVETCRYIQHLAGSLSHNPTDPCLASVLLWEAVKGAEKK